MRQPLREVLGPGGALSRVLPAYEPRPPQLAMAESVEDALGHGRALLVEAGTGTGKTLAYLLPAVRSGLKVVVSTAIKTLQEQLAEKLKPEAGKQERRTLDSSSPKEQLAEQFTKQQQKLGKITDKLTAP